MSAALDKDVRIIVPEPRPTSDVPYHHDRAPGQKYLLLDPTVVPDTPIYVALRRVDAVPAAQPEWLDPHAHVCNSFYVFLGDRDDLAGLEGEVAFGSDWVQVRSPSSALIPPLLLHRYRLTRGSGWYLQITLCPTYEASLADPSEWQAALDPRLTSTLCRKATPAETGLRLIDDGLFTDPAVTVGLSEGKVSSGSGFALHVAFSRGGTPAAVSVSCHDEPLATPVAILTRNRGTVVEQVSEKVLVVSIRPDPAPRSGNRQGG
jgi:hypothetical protein